MLPEISLSVSSDITRELKEFERTSTTVIDAYVKPVVERYLSSLDSDLQEAGIDARLLVMQSNGAVMSVDAAREHPCFLIESGPAAGVIAGQAIARQTGERNLITFDMGGTTAKAALVEDGEIGLTDEYEVGAGITVGTRLMKGDGYLLRIPAIDLAEVGAGGGSIAWIDAGGRLQVGPQSAGAFPGPACYGQGGAEPTITDANVVLGYLDPQQFAGKAVQVDPELAWNALEPVAAQLNSSVRDTALAIHLVGNARMSRPIRAVTVERGLDVRDFTLLAFGGSGPIHAANLAAELGINHLLVPPFAGVFSAVGLSLANAGHHFVRTFRRRLDQLDHAAFMDEIDDLRREAASQLARLNYPAGEIDFATSADMRYAGQAFNLTVDLADALAAPDRATRIAADAFASLHERTYGHRAEGDPVEVVNLRLRATIGNGDGWMISGQREPNSGRRRRTREMLFTRGEEPLETPILARSDLTSPTDGPLAIEEPDTTIIVPPGCRASTDAWGNVRVEVGKGR